MALCNIYDGSGNWIRGKASLLELKLNKYFYIVQLLPHILYSTYVTHSVVNLITVWFTIHFNFLIFQVMIEVSDITTHLQSSASWAKLPFIIQSQVTACKFKIMVFWDMMECNLMCRYQLFKRINCFHTKSSTDWLYRSRGEGNGSQSILGYSKLHDVTSQKTVFLTLIVMRTINVTHFKVLFWNMFIKLSWKITFCLENHCSVHYCTSEIQFICILHCPSSLVGCGAVFNIVLHCTFCFEASRMQIL